MTKTTKQKRHRNKPVISTIVTLVAVVIMCSLGMWQLQRAEEKTIRLEQIESRKSAAPLQLADVLNSQEDLRDFPIEMYGSALTDNVFLLDNKQYEGQVGYQVLVPVQTNSGLVLVNFGWVKGSQYRDQLPNIELPDGQRLLRGIAAVPELNPMVMETASVDGQWPKVIQQIDLPFLETFVNEPLHGFIMLLSPQQPGGFIRQWQPVVMPPEKHLAYAVQWFGLAIASMLVFIFAVRTRFKENND